LEKRIGCESQIALNLWRNFSEEIGAFLDQAQKLLTFSSYFLRKGLRFRRLDVLFPPQQAIFHHSGIGLINVRNDVSNSNLLITSQIKRQHD